MPRPRLPYLYPERNRHGTLVWYVRVGKGPRTRIREPYGTNEFAAAYHAAIAGKPSQRKLRGSESGSVEWLIDRYRETTRWGQLSPATRRQRENVFKSLVSRSGKTPSDQISRADIQATIDSKLPASGRHFLQAMRGLFEWAAGNARLVPIDPTAGVKAASRKTDGHHVWSLDECARFEARWPVGTRQRIAFDVLLYTGLRRGDAVTLGHQHIRNGVATIRTEKTGETVTLPILPPLARSIAAGPTGDLALIAGERGAPMRKESFGTWFRLQCKAAGVPGSAHGLRKASATRAAEAGATEHELMAMFGWSDPRMAFVYTRKANRARLARDGAEKVVRKHGM
jgi:integrase